MDANPTIAPAAAAATGGEEQGPATTPRSTTAALSAAAASSSEPALAEAAATAAATVDALDSDAAETDANDDASETSAAAAADATTRAGTGVALRPKPAAAAAQAAAAPVVSAPLRTTPVAAALPPRRKWCSIYNLFVAAVVLGFVALTGLAWWLRPALMKAWSGQRSPDYPSEAHFSADGIASGCVSSTLRSGRTGPLPLNSTPYAPIPGPNFRSRPSTTSRPFFSASSSLLTTRRSECARASMK